MVLTTCAHQVHDKGEEGEGWWKQRVWVKELDCKVQACISEEEKYGQILEVTTMHVHKREYYQSFAL